MPWLLFASLVVLAVATEEEMPDLSGGCKLAPSEMRAIPAPPAPYEPIGLAAAELRCVQPCHVIHQKIKKK